MHTIGSSCRRRGTSTVFGVMIFIGIMFTAVIPMFLVMNQADTLQEIRKVEVGRLDEEHATESVFFHLETSIDFDSEAGVNKPIIKLVFYNRCEIAVKIVHVWINGELREVNYLIPPTGQDSWVLRDFVEYDIGTPLSFSVMAVTDKGNILLPPSGNPEYSFILGLGGSWKHEVYSIYIMMTQKRSQLRILVIRTNEFDGAPIEPHTTIFNDGVAMNLDGYLIGVPYDGTYRVIVTWLHEIELTEDGGAEVRLGEDCLAALVII